VSAPRPLRWDLAGFALEVRVPSGVVEPLHAIWGDFVATTPGPADLVVDVEVVAPSPELRGRQTEVARDGDGDVCVRMVEGTVELRASGSARISARAAASPGDLAWAVHNLLLPAIAWHLADRRAGALVHGAAVVIDGRAHVLAGPEGSGKSTFATVAGAAGVDVLGEDLVLLDGAGGRVDAVAAPYRVERATRRGPGRWPLAGILFPRHGAAPSIAPASDLAGVARLAANLPYVAGTDAGIAVARAIAARVPLRELTFAPDPSFLALLRDPGAGAGPAGGATGQ